MPTTSAFKGLIFEKFYRLSAGSFAAAIIGLLIVSVVISGCTMVGPDYVNAAAVIGFAGKPRSLLDVLHRVEAQFGRPVRQHTTRPGSPGVYRLLREFGRGTGRGITTRRVAGQR